MTDHTDPLRRLARAPMPRRNRRRWAAAAGVAGCWLLLMIMTGSVVTGTVVLALLAVLGAGCVAGLRFMGVDGGHPLLRQLATRPWRDGNAVLRVALRHLSEVLVVAPNGSLLAPDSVQLRLSPRDFGSLAERIDIGLVCSSATKVYEEQVAARGARFAGPGPAWVAVISDPSVPAGRYRLRPGRPEPGAPGGGPGPAPGYGAGPAPGYGAGPAPGYGAGPAPGYGAGPGHDGHTLAGAALATAAGPGLPTVAEPLGQVIPPLSLVTGDQVTQTRTSGARAGRGAVDLVLPQVPTVSREHASFTFADGQWWIANLGRNGLTLNGVPVARTHPVRDGDSIRWGRKPDALESRVQIG